MLPKTAVHITSTGIVNYVVAGIYVVLSYHVGDTEDTDGGYVYIRLCTCRYVITLFLGSHHKGQGEPSTFYPEGEGKVCHQNNPGELRLLDTFLIFTILRWQVATRLML